MDIDKLLIEISKNFLSNDLVNNKRFTHDLGKNVKGGETVFAPKSKDSDEDDGWILMLAYEEETEKALDLPSGVHSYAIIPIGYPIGNFGPVGRGNLRDFVSLDRIGQKWDALDYIVRQHPQQ